ncbi:hypothetical protein D3C81_1000340 [compost metagenome]
MSKISGGAKRRELLMLWIRKNVKYGGMPVNRRGFNNTKDPDIQALFKKGLIKQVREDRSFRGLHTSHTKLTRLLPVDGIALEGDVMCPDCGYNLSNISMGRRVHAVNCSLRTDHKMDPGSSLRREQLKRRNNSIKIIKEHSCR